MTGMNEAIITALDILEERKALYRKLGTSYYRPWIFLLTDGNPTDFDYEAGAIQRLHEAITEHKVTFWPMAIGPAPDIQKLKNYANGGPVLKASASQFKEAFVWLSSSLSAVTNDENAPSPSPVLTIEI